MKFALIALFLALVSACSYPSGYYAHGPGLGAENLTTVCRIATHRFTLTASARACRRKGGNPI